jgi:hypothetical protein
MSTPLDLNEVGRMHINSLDTYNADYWVRPEYIVLVFKSSHGIWITLLGHHSSISISEEEFDRLKSLGF